jgi:RNA polymerase sigma-70 factor (ECF subfamily)
MVRGMTDVNREDWDLMQAVSQGDESASAMLYDRFGALVFRAARQVLPTRAEAEDAVQEVFVRLWRTAERYDPERAKLVTWVMLITRRHLIDRLRRRRVRPLDLSLEGEPVGRERSASESPGRIEQDEHRNLLLARIRELPVLQQEVIERAYLQGFTLREVAEQLDAPLGTVKSALSRGLARLRDRLSEDHRVRGELG